MSLTSRIRISVDALYMKQLDLGVAEDTFKYGKMITLLDGVGNGNADLLFHDQRTIAISGNEDLDLFGSLSNEFGVILSIAKLKALFIVAADLNTNNVRVTRPATLSFPLFLTTSDAIDVQPGGAFVFIAPNAGVTVSAGSDVVNIANSGAGTTVTYDVVIIGASA
jgi:hypothetical protein